MTTVAAELGVTPFLDRDLSWLQFDWRVLHKALDVRTPFLERVKFLAIFNSNLDEFFMKRFARLRQRVVVPDGPGDAEPAPLHLLRLREAILPMLAAQAEVFTSVIRPQLAKHGIHLLGWSDLTEPQCRYAEHYFHRNVFPVLTPLAVDPGHPFPFLSNLSTSLGILLHGPESEDRLFARVKVPDVFPQWVPLPEESAYGQPGARLSFVQVQHRQPRHRQAGAGVVRPQLLGEDVQRLLQALPRLGRPAQ